MRSIRQTLLVLIPSLITFGCGGPELEAIGQRESSLEHASLQDGYILRSVAGFAAWNTSEFDKFDVAAGGPSDGKIGMADLDALWKNVSEHRIRRMAAGVILENFARFDSMNTGASAGLLEREELRKVASDWSFKGSIGISHMEAGYVAAVAMNNTWIDGSVDCGTTWLPNPPPCPQRPRDGLIDLYDARALKGAARDEYQLAGFALEELFWTFDTAAHGGTPDGYIGMTDFEVIVSASGLNESR